MTDFEKFLELLNLITQKADIESAGYGEDIHIAFRNYRYNAFVSLDTNGWWEFRHTNGEKGGSKSSTFYPTIRNALCEFLGVSPAGS